MVEDIVASKRHVNLSKYEERRDLIIHEEDSGNPVIFRDYIKFIQHGSATCGLILFATAIALYVSIYLFTAEWITKWSYSDYEEQ